MNERSFLNTTKVKSKITIARRPKTSSITDNTQSLSGDGKSSGSTELTSEQRRQIEQVGVELVRLQLEKQGLKVEPNQANKVYDLLARRNGEEYHIEVKAH